MRGAGGGCHCRLSLRRGTSAASSSRRGPTRPGLAASGESPNPPGTLPRLGTDRHPGRTGRSWNGRSPPDRDHCAVCLPGGPPTAPHSSETPASRCTLTDDARPAGRCLCALCLQGPPGGPFPTLLQVWGHWKTPPVWGGAQTAQVTDNPTAPPPIPKAATPKSLPS